MRNFFVILCLALLIVLNSCMDHPAKGPEETVASNVPVTTPISYGNGVYYFNCNQREFAGALSVFIKDVVTSDLEIKAIASDGTSIYGYDKGYFVIVAKK